MTSWWFVQFCGVPEDGQMAALRRLGRIHSRGAADARAPFPWAEVHASCSAKDLIEALGAAGPPVRQARLLSRPGEGALLARQVEMFDGA